MDKNGVVLVILSLNIPASIMACRAEMSRTGDCQAIEKGLAKVAEDEETNRAE